jgi:hypothetical protein
MKKLSTIYCFRAIAKHPKTKVLILIALQDRDRPVFDCLSICNPISVNDAYTAISDQKSVNLGSKVS